MNERVNKYRRIESDAKDLRFHEYTIVLFADVRSERHSDSDTTHIEKEWKEGPREGRAV